ncbi:hypothetical protein [Nakamurella leprariae]|uniref:Uncharacterized protein n=1 Tax=Nakamurella leprariae TaxID=2803911 RepID=A0A938YG75_9ACTN|nr:hypothetical protein [Nakamurella leprariae]MBM9469003.1 hypothetical protein [Nakamurella leprariae]
MPDAAKRFHPRHALTDDDDSTLSTVRRQRKPAYARWLRRFGAVALLAIVVAGATGWLGVRAGTVRATADGWTLELTYPRVARAGLDVPVSIRVTAPEPLAERPLTLTVDRAFLDLFETQGWNPEPSATTGDGDRVALEFDTAPEGDVFRADYDAYIQPSSQIGIDARVGLEVDDEEIVSVGFTTTLLP